MAGFFQDIGQGVHVIMTLATLVAVGFLIYFYIKDRKKIEAAYQNTRSAVQSLESFGQAANCISCSICNSTNPTIQALVTATGICGSGSCINTAGCPPAS